MGGIFISYRRADTSGQAGRLHSDLAGHFGDSLVFRDVNTLRPGVPFEKALNEYLSKTSVMLVLVGSRWLEDDGHRFRLNDPDDWVRREIESGLGRPIRVIPTLVDGANLPDVNLLPESIRPLFGRQAQRLVDDDGWNDTVRRICNEIAPDVLSPASRRLRTFWKPMAAAVAVILAGCMFAIFWPERAPQTVGLRFDVPQPQVCFHHDPVNRVIKTDFVWRLKPTIRENHESVSVILGIARVDDAGLIDKGIKPRDFYCSEAPKKSCKGLNIWNRIDDPIVLKGGSDGTDVNWTMDLPEGTAAIYLRYQFWQREAGIGEQCIVDKSKKYRPEEQLPFLKVVDADGNSPPHSQCQWSGVNPAEPLGRLIPVRTDSKC